MIALLRLEKKVEIWLFQTNKKSQNKNKIF
jgi:hypothetical protein